MNDQSSFCLAAIHAHSVLLPNSIRNCKQLQLQPQAYACLKERGTVIMVPVIPRLHCMLNNSCKGIQNCRLQSITGLPLPPTAAASLAAVCHLSVRQEAVDCQPKGDRVCCSHGVPRVGQLHQASARDSGCQQVLCFRRYDLILRTCRGTKLVLSNQSNPTATHMVYILRSSCCCCTGSAMWQYRVGQYTYKQPQGCYVCFRLSQPQMLVFGAMQHQNAVEERNIASTSGGHTSA